MFQCKVCKQDNIPDGCGIICEGCKGELSQVEIEKIINTAWAEADEFCRQIDTVGAMAKNKACVRCGQQTKNKSLCAGCIEEIRNPNLTEEEEWEE